MTELISTEEINGAMDALKDLNEKRKQISEKLGSISVKYQLREKVLNNLYNYYEMVTDDYYCLIDRVIKSPEAVELMRDGIQNQKEKLQKEMNRMRHVLDNPIKFKEVKPTLNKIDNYIFYKIRKNLT